ncbi:hypothetical protein GOB94_01390 [Granulicella sp. 5B5]|uniref:hypothetical protein n=1 Tax=Granulicella sp. 5B5 TaxID=1617967 RepID=UPI0015F486F3|nr:hypothetical protein [Granulicella sp. 5B5]QMV17509.1 hypothetical protein GOB94_01390 [Granulicella sp. 5B5]
MTCKIRRAALIGFGLISSSLAFGQLRIREQFPVAQIAVERAIAHSLFHQEVVIAGVQVKFFSEAVASKPVVHLEVQTVMPWKTTAGLSSKRRQLVVRMACKVSGTCLPFYVLVDLPTEMAIADVPSISRVKVVPELEQQKKPIVVLQRGARATLVLNDGVSLIQIPVVSLQDGAAGETVRVASLNRKHVYEGITISASMLKGEF